MSKFTITQELDERLAHAMIQTWNAIAYDCFIGMDGEVDPSITLERDEVVELVVDANHIFYITGDEEIDNYCTYLYSHHEDHFRQVCCSAFPEESYGY